MFTICGRANSGVPRIIIRPITFVSIPEPDLSLPMASTTRTSAASNGSDGASRLASARSAASAGPPNSDGLEERDPGRPVVAVLDDRRDRPADGRTRR